MKKHFAILYMILMGTSVFAQSDTTVVLEQIYVNAGRLEQPISESGRNIKVITRSELMASNVRSLDEAIQLLGGVEVQTRGAYGSQADFSIQGSTFGQVQVLVDGQPVNDPLTGHFNSNIPVNFYDIEQIEIVKGPSSSVYGPDAVGGVINIVTNAFQGKSKGFNLNGGFGLGEHDLRTYDIGGQLRLAGIAGSIQFAKSRTDGPDHPLDSTSQYAKVSTLTTGLGYKRGKWHIQTRASWDKRDFDARNYYTLSTADRSVEEVDRLWLQGLLKYDIDSVHNLRLNVSQIRTEDDFLFNPAFPSNEHTTTRADIRLEWSATWNERIRSLIGINYSQRSIESNDRGDHDDDRLGFFLLGEYKIDDHWVVSPSVRFDSEDEYDLEINPQLAISYNIGDWSARLFAGRSIRTADYTERYISYGRTTVLSSGRNLGNPLLAPEKAWTFETGVTYQPMPSFSLGLNAFLRNGEDLIDYILTPASEIEDTSLLDPQGTYFYAQNISDLTSHGADLFARYKWRIAQKVACNASVNYTWVDSDSDEAALSKYISSHANHFLNWSLGATYQDIGLTINGLYKSRTAEYAEAINAELSENYHVVNAKLTLGVIGRGLQLYVQVHNVFDTEYADILGARLPGQWWSGGLKFNWK